MLYKIYDIDSLLLERWSIVEVINIRICSSKTNKLQIYKHQKKGDEEYLHIEFWKFNYWLKQS